MIRIRSPYSSYTLALTFIALFISSTLFAQNKVDGDNLYRAVDSLYVEEGTINPVEAVSPWTINTTVGSSVMFMPGYGSASNIFMAPHATYSATQRLSFHGGMVASIHYPLSGSIGSEMGSMQSFPNLSMFVAASYMVTSDLVVYGTGMKSLLNQELSGPGNNFSRDNFSIGAAYSIGNFTIGASISSGYRNPYGASPFNSGRGFYPSPFYW